MSSASNKAKFALCSWRKIESFSCNSSTRSTVFLATAIELLYGAKGLNVPNLVHRKVSKTLELEWASFDSVCNFETKTRLQTKILWKVWQQELRKAVRLYVWYFFSDASCSPWVIASHWNHTIGTYTKRLLPRQKHCEKNKSWLKTSKCFVVHGISWQNMKSPIVSPR